MGFDNECIVNIQSLAGEYFCPVCRLLVYPNEALQSQCTHLYCKPCLTYIVSTTRACPYDGYLVTEADSKPLTESNKILVETIGKISVHCLYHRSGCTWQGSLSECISHCSACTFGNSPVVCNRCGIQIVHRQVQEHAQNCPGVQTQVQQATQDVSASNATATTDQSQSANQVGAMASQAPSSQTVAVTTAPGQHANLLGNPTSQTQPLVQAAVQPTAEQWYQQQQQQQYYQHHQGYDPYQQHYQQCYLYQQPAFPQYQQDAQAYTQPLPQTQPQPQPQAQPQSQPQAQPQSQPQTQPQPISHVQAPVALQSQNQMQANQQQSIQPALQPHSQIQPVSHPPGHGQATPQSQPLPQPYLYPQAQPQPQQHITPHYHRPHPQMLHAQPQAQQPLQSYPVSQPQVHQQLQPIASTQHISQPQIHPHQPNQPQLHLYHPNLPLTPNIQPQVQHTSANAVTGHHSYPQPQPHQIMQLGAPQHSVHIHPQGGPQPLSQHPVQMQNQFPQQSPMMRPLQPHYMFPNQQQSALLSSPVQGQSFPFSQQQTVQVHAQPPVQANQRPVMHPVQQPLPQQPSVQQQMSVSSHVRPQGPAYPIPEHMHAYPQPQTNVVLSHYSQLNQSQNTVGRPFMPNHPAQPLAQSASALPVKPTHAGVSHLHGNQNMMVGTNNQLQLSAELQFKVSEPIEGQAEVVTEQKADSPPGKLGISINDLGTISGSATEMKHVRSGSDVEYIEDGSKQKGEDPQSVKTSGTNADALEKGDSVNQNLVKEDAGVQNDTVNEHSVVKDKEIENSSLQETELSEPLSAKLQKDDMHTQQTEHSVHEYRGITPRGPGLSLPAQFVDQGKHQQLIINYGQRPPVDVASQLPHPGVPNQPLSAGLPSAQFQNHGPSHALHPGHPLNSAENFQPPTVKPPQGSEIQHGAIPGSGSFSSHGGEPTHRGAPGQTFQPQSLGPPGSYNHGQAPPLPSGASNLSRVENVRPGMMANLPPPAPEVLRSHQHPSNVMATETYPHQRPGYLNGPQGFGLQEERFKSFPVPGQHSIDRREFEDDLKKFPRPSLDAEWNTKVGGYSLGPRDCCSHGFNYDGGSKMISGKSDRARYGLTPISPLGEYAEMPSSRPEPLSGGLVSKSDIDDFDGRGPRRFGGSVSTVFGDSGFPHLPSHFHRGEFEGPGNFRMGEHPRSGGFIGEDSFAGHFRRGEHLGPHNLPRHFAHSGNMPTTEPGGPHSFESFNRNNRPGHPQLGEPGFRSSFSLSGFPNDGGYLTGDMGSFDDLWKRKAASMGWCRICKVDCESVEGLDLHSQTREHQKMAMDMVKTIKQNAKKQKLTSNEQSSVEDGSKSRNIGFQGRGIKH